MEFYGQHSRSEFPIEKQRDKWVCRSSPTLWDHDEYMAGDDEYTSDDSDKVCVACFGELEESTGLCFDCDYDELVRYAPEAIATRLGISTEE